MAKPVTVTPDELKRVELYMQKTFGNTKIKVKGRQKAADAAEVFVGEDFIGLVAKGTKKQILRTEFEGGERIIRAGDAAGLERWPGVCTQPR